MGHGLLRARELGPDLRNHGLGGLVAGHDRFVTLGEADRTVRFEPGSDQDVCLGNLGIAEQAALQPQSLEHRVEGIAAWRRMLAAIDVDRDDDVRAHGPDEADRDDGQHAAIDIGSAIGLHGNHRARHRCRGLYRLSRVAVDESRALPAPRSVTVIPSGTGNSRMVRLPVTARIQDA